MKWNAMSLLTIGVWLVGPAAASACETTLNHRFWRIPGAGFVASAGVQIQPGSDGEDTGMVFTADVGFPLMGRAVVAPAMGLCKYGDFSEPVFGGAGAFNIFNNAAGTLALNVQAAVTHTSFEGGSELNYPIALAGAFTAAPTVDIIFGGGMLGTRDTFEFAGVSGSESDFDPYAFGGAALDAGPVALQGSLSLKKGDSDTDFVFSVVVGIPLGAG